MAIDQMLEAVHISEVSVYFKESTWRFIPEDAMFKRWLFNSGDNNAACRNSIKPSYVV
jgi:hypothetical protein